MKDAIIEDSVCLLSKFYGVWNINKIKITTWIIIITNQAGLYNIVYISSFIQNTILVLMNSIHLYYKIAQVTQTRGVTR